MLLVDVGTMLFGVFGVNNGVFNLFYHMGCDEPSPVGNGGSEVGDLKGSGKNLTLAYGY